MSSGPRLNWKLLAVWFGATLVLVAAVLFSYYVWIEPRESQEASAENLGKIARAMQAHNDKHKRLPAAAIYHKDGKPLLSWRVALLPFLGEERLYRDFKLDEPWDSPPNIRLLTRMPKVYAPVRGGPAPGHTYYQVFTGLMTPFRGSVAPRIPHTFRDGTASTFLIVEADDAVPWTKPADLIVAENRPLPRLGGHWSDGFLVAMADGSTRLVNPRDLGEKKLRELINPADPVPDTAGWEH
jgi:hypothetical protein